MGRLIAVLALALGSLLPDAGAAQSGGNVEWKSWWIKLDTTTERCTQMSEQALKAMGYTTLRYGPNSAQVDGLHPTAPLRIEAICNAPSYVHVFAVRYPSGEVTPNAEVQRLTANMKALLAGQPLPTAPTITPAKVVYPPVTVGWLPFTGTQADCVAKSDAVMRRLGYATLPNPQANWVGMVGTTSDGGSVMTRCDVKGVIPVYSATRPGSPRDSGSLHSQFVAELTKAPLAAGPTAPAASGSGQTPEKLQAALVGVLNKPSPDGRRLLVFDIGPNDSSPLVELGMYRVRSARSLRQCVIEVTGEYYVRNPSTAYTGAKGTPKTQVLDLTAMEDGDLSANFDGGVMADDETQRGYQMMGATTEEGFMIGRAIQSLWNSCG